MTIRYRTQLGFSLIEFIIAMTIFTIVMMGIAAAFTVSLATARDQQDQALLNSETQAASKILDADIRQSGFLLASGSNNTLPLFVRSGHPVASVEIVDGGHTLRCVRLADESGGRVVEGVSPAGTVTDTTTEMTVAGNPQNLTTRIGASRAFIFVAEGQGRQGRLFITNSAPTLDATIPNLVHLRGAFSGGSCLNVGDSDQTPSDYRGLVMIPISAYVEYRFEDEGLVRYEYSGSTNLCGGTSSVIRKLLIQNTHLSDGNFGYLLTTPTAGVRVLPLQDIDFPKLRGVMVETRRRVQVQSRTEITASAIAFTLNDQW